MSSYQITLAEAVNYLYNFNQDSNLYSIAQNTAFGGTFDMPTLPTAADKGLMFWFNWINNGGSTEFYLAYQEYDDPGKGVRMKLPVGNTDLLIPDEIFQYSSSGNSIQDIENFILNHDTNVPPRSSITSRSAIETQSQDFLDHFPSGSVNDFNLRSHNFYQARASSGDLLTLLSQTGAAGLRYYFGLEPQLGFINQLRLILVAVDSTGGNILSNSGASILLQKGTP